MAHRQKGPTLVSFTVSKRDSTLIELVVDRAVKAGLVAKVPNARLNLEMDLTAAKANGCPIDFKKLLEFEDFDFGHHVVLISRHMDRTTGQLTDNFYPRSARPNFERVVS